MYHTALPHGELTDAEPAQAWMHGQSRAFVHDLRWGLPEDFHFVDVIYADLPWRDGYDEFNRRADAIDPLPYGDWLYLLSRELATLNIPWVKVGGYAAARHLACEWFLPVRLNGSLAMALGAGGPLPPEHCRDALAVLQWLSSNPEYKRVGDFCCGYGLTGQIFGKAGKSFILSDINPSCIGHVAREAPQWLSATT